MNRLLCAALAAAGLTACDGDFSRFGTPEPIPKDERTIVFETDSEDSGWDAGFSDYDIRFELDFDLEHEFERLPAPLAHLDGLRVAGTNHSDDLFMFIKKRYTGFRANSRYELTFKITIATNAPKGCAGIGGAPGEDVYIKAGATTFEPLAQNDGTGFLLMNLDKGNQSTGGSDAIVLGDFASSQVCGEVDEEYELKTLGSGNQSFIVETNAAGDLWLMFGTDSGFEGRTTIYYISGELVAKES